jgi:hypothetical protein
LAFGGPQYGGGDAPNSVRWCDQENILNWDESDPTQTAGSIPLSQGSGFLCIQQTNREILAWTTSALYSIQYIGSPDIYTATLVESHSDILSMNASASYQSIVMWVGRSGFYIYDGRVRRLECPVWDYFAQRVDLVNHGKIFASSNAAHGEVIFFYESEDGSDIDSYITYNVEENHWTVGSLSRTAWIDTDAEVPAIGVGLDGYFYQHDTGADDGSANPPSAIDAYIESAPFELSSEGSFDKGDRFYFIRKVVPDVSFRSYTNSDMDTPSVNMVLKTMDYPGGGLTTDTTTTTTRTATLPIEEFTTHHNVRLRGRACVVRLESDVKGSLWRLGTPRLDIRPDGQR